MSKDLSRFNGIVMQNDQVAGYIAKHGAPSFSKPHGANKNILYYPNPDAVGQTLAGEPEFIDYAGKETPNTRTIVVQGNPQGSVVSSRVVRAGAAPNAAHFDGNPNREVADADIKNAGDLDDEIIELEEEHAEARLSPPEAGYDGAPVPAYSALSLGEKVAKVEQEPTGANSEDLEALEVVPSRETTPVIGPELPEGKRAPGDTGKKTPAKKSSAKKTTRKSSAKRGGRKGSR